jgi:hypothetical protein
MNTNHAEQIILAKCSLDRLALNGPHVPTAKRQAAARRLVDLGLLTKVRDEPDGRISVMLTQANIDQAERAAGVRPIRGDR